MAITTRYLHQIETQNFINKTPYCLIASEMGCGKSINAIDTAVAFGGKCLIVSPMYLARNWKREFLKFADIEATIFPNTNSRVIIASADIIYKHPELFNDLSVLVIDEAHNFNNSKSRRASCLHNYVSKFKPERLLLLTGTPIRGKVTELYSPLLLLHGEKFSRHFKNPWIFFSRYSNKVQKRIGGRIITSFEGFKNLDELKQQWLKGVYIKYKLADIMDLPDVMYDEVVLNIPETLVTKKLDAGLEETGWRTLSLGQVPTSTAFPTLKKENAILKTTEAIKFIKGLLDTVSPIVVFSDHLEPVRMVKEEIPGAECITGATSAADRDALVVKFQEGKIPVLVGTLPALGTGCNLFASNTVVFIDKSVVVSTNAQAIGRILRIGQTRKCRIIELVRQGIDQKINRILRGKDSLIKESGL